MDFNIPFTGFFYVGTKVGGFSLANLSTTMQVVSSLSPFACKASFTISLNQMVSDLEENVLQVIGQGRHALSFGRFATRCGKRYDTVEEMKNRFKIFSDSIELIKSTNKKCLSYILGVNHFADGTWKEFKRSRFGAAQNCSATLKGNHKLSGPRIHTPSWNYPS
ncbi:Papain-like cysteine peptidase superfamily [Sesbania bispinosa]|nr:Papain-like cysteine peptidase superfamily [Sesbania bispinosa]